MKKPLTIFILLLASAIWILPSAVACDFDASRADVFDPKDFTPTPSPSEWMSPAEFAVHHIEVEPFHMEKIPAVKIELPEEQATELLSPLPDGGCLAVSMKPVAGVSPKVTLYYNLRAICYKPDGTVLWDLLLDGESVFGGYATALSIFPDGAFAVAVRIHSVQIPNGDPVDRLYRFSPEGHLQWKTSDTPFPAGTIEHLFSLPDGALLAVGTVTDREEGSDISLIRMEQDGMLTKQLTLGTSPYDTLMDADYAVGIGLVVIWRGEKNASLTDTAARHTNALVCYNEQLQESWTTVMAPGEPLYQVDAVSDAGILAQGFVQDATSSRSSLFCFSPLGAKTWTYTPSDQPSWVTGAAVLTDERTAVASYRQSEENGQETLLTILADDGAIIGEMDRMPGTAIQLIPTAEGEFTVVLRQEVRTLPQPLHISSIWTDTEAIVAHYDKDLQLIWRRTIDQYKHSIRTDTIIATADDRLLIG